MVGLVALMVVIIVVALGIGATIAIRKALHGINVNKAIENLDPQVRKERNTDKRVAELWDVIEKLDKKSEELPKDHPRQELIKTYRELCHREIGVIIAGREETDWNIIEGSAREVLELE